MIKLGDLEIRTALLCEDVRQEKNNKFILIGVFVNDMVLSAMPAPVPICFFMEIQAKKAGEYRVTFRLSGPGKDSARIKIGLQIKDKNEIIALPSPKLEILMAQEGVFRIDASIDEKKWTKLVSKKVLLDPSIASPQLSELS